MDDKSKARTPVQTRFLPSTVDAIDEVCARTGETRSETIRQAVEQHLASRKCRRCHGSGKERE